MNKITFPLKPRMNGTKVWDLQDALQFLLNKAAILSNDEAARQKLSVALLRERAKQTYGSNTGKLVSTFQKERQLQNSGAVDEPTADALNRLLDKLSGPNGEQPKFVVKGTVRFNDGFSADRIMVSAFDRDLRAEQLLGQASTDKTGAYEIQYLGSQFHKAEKNSADLVIKVFGADHSLLATSLTLFNAPPVANVDVMIPAEALQPPTLFEKLGRALKPLLEELKVEELEEDERHQDLSFLSGETGFEKTALARFVLAHKPTLHGIQTEFWFVLLGGSFYQFADDQSLAEQLVKIMKVLPSLDAVAVRKALARGFHERDIPESFRDKVNDWIEAFLNFTAALSISDGTKPTFMKSALIEAGITSPVKQTKFARLYNEHMAVTPELIGALEKDRSFKKAEIADLRTSFQLSELTRGDFSVVNMVKKEFGVRQPEQIRTLAKQSEEKWVRVVKAKFDAGQVTLPIEVGDLAGPSKLPIAEVYGKMLERQFRDAFPTTAFAGGLGRALDNGGARGLRQPEVLSRFLEHHNTFELLNTSIDDFLKNEVQPDFRTLAQNDSFRQELKAVQRVFKLAPRFEATDALLADDLHSAQKIYRQGKSEFVGRYGNRAGFTPETARLTWNRAADTHAAALTVVADLKALDAEGLPLALKNNSEALSTFPNWNNLFKTGDLCECEHCRSVLSPAAYFTDLLMFLKDRESAKPGVRVKDILFGRRPDLGYLELNCANALTPLPYVDVVCEVLESVVAGDANDLQLTGFMAMPTDPSAAKAAVAAAFTAQQISLGADLSLTQVTPSDPNQWVAHGEDITYLLKKNGSPNFFAEILRNTKASAEELRAYPQYVNPKSYAKLKAAQYPLGLPFDLFAEEVRAAFTKCNLQRWDLMRTFRGATAPTNGDIAAEYFGISADTAALRFNGLMTATQRTTLLTHPSLATVTSLPAYQQAIQQLFEQPGWAPVMGLPVDFAFPTAITGAPNSIPISYKPFAFDEKHLILVADPTVTGQQTVWGEVGNSDWLATVMSISDPKLASTLANVKTFLQKTGLEYNDLLALLDLKFINPGGDMGIQHLDVSCDTDKKVIKSLDAAKLDRIHRFLRMWRKLKGWKMWELDLVVRHPRIGNEILDETFLQELYDFSEVKNKLGGKPTVEQVCALFGDLNTESRFTTLYEKREDALYQSLFLNKRLIQPLDPAFQLDATGNEILPILDPSTGLPVMITAHHPSMLGALGIREADLAVLKELTKPFPGPVYITDDLTLSNVSFLWRHAWLSRLLKLKAEEWKSLLKLAQQDIPFFVSPKAALAFIDTASSIKATGFSPDDLNWILAGDRSAKAAMKETAAAHFLSTLRRELQAIQSQYDGVAVPLDVEGRTALLTALLQTLNRDDASVQFFLATLRDEVSIETAVAELPTGFDFPPTIIGAPNNIRISYDEIKQTLRFTGVMNTDEQTTLLNDPSLAAVTGDFAYQAAIEDLFTRPRLALKFFEPVFTSPLANLPPEVDFNSLTDQTLASRVTYNSDDTEQRLFRVTGILSKDDSAALDTLSPDGEYRTAVNTLFTQPRTIVSPDERIWLFDTDLIFPLKDHLGDNLATAVSKALPYLSKRLSTKAAVQSAATELGLIEALSQRLLGDYPVMPDSLLTYLTGPFFVATSGAVEYATFQPIFDGWFWASRVATIWKKWKLTVSEYEKFVALPAGAQLLDFSTAPLSLEKFLRTSRLFKLRDSLPETGITLLDVLGNLGKSSYSAADFASDVQRLNDAWPAADVEALISSLDLTYPDAYLLSENWDRLRRAFYFLDALNAGPDVVKDFAAGAMTDLHAKTVKELLRSKFGAEAWLTLSQNIQDVLRERKRDALTAYLLSQPRPGDPPTGKWENTNDLYAYYLLDVEMGACLLTSRLVQASGSVQLFVQRCFMGLEPYVEVNSDGATGDSPWRWWKWMRKYRVWEANRKVFLWPENWIEPELKPDRSSFFKDLENELLQSDINASTVETAFTNYLEKLDNVAQLEIAGFYQEDDGDNPVLHVFGRTRGAEPHLYYYRRYDYRRGWTPWMKVNLNIQGEYIIPAVVNKRLFLFWPVFTEVPDEEGNSTVLTPDAHATVQIPRPRKKLRVQLAESRGPAWTPAKISKDFYESPNYNVDIARKFYRFFPVDRSDIDGRFVIRFDGFSLGSNGIAQAWLYGAFDIGGCRGVPERTSLVGDFTHSIQPEWASVGQYYIAYTTFQKWIELGGPNEYGHPVAPRHDAPEDDFTLENVFASTKESVRYAPVLLQTPWFFTMSPAWHLSYFDKLLLNGSLSPTKRNKARCSIGSWLPFFYNDKKRTFFVLPTLWQTPIEGNIGGRRIYYPDIKNESREREKYYEEQTQVWLDNFPLSSLTSPQRQQLEQFLHEQFPEEVLPPYSEEQVKGLMKRLRMRYWHYDLGTQSLQLFQNRQFHFKNFYHPFVCDFAKLVYNPLKGIPALMSRETQLKGSGFSFDQTYRPTGAVVKLPPQYPTLPDCYPREDVDFTPDGAYSPYNWELFFHVPLLIANSLSKNQRFEEARDWYHFMFNPIGVESPMAGGPTMSKYWITKPFFQTTDPQYIQQRIENILRMLAGDTSVAGYSMEAKRDLEDQVLDWRTHPFEPHRIANYRTVAYQKTVVMKYLDNLIAWGDNLFRQDSMESINEAGQLYIMAAEILGPRPKKIPPQAKPPVESFNELESAFDAYSNALVEVENLIPPLSGTDSDGSDLAPLPMLYFCIPQNDKLLSYWDTVADRLFKIRHCMNIEGVVRQLALFEPPIDPGALVKAVAAGVDIESALADLNAPLPLYRFNVLLQKANEFCNDVKSLGSALLSALEKRDAEELGLLRQSQEVRILEAVKAVREKQIEEAKENLEAVKKSKELAQKKKQYYESREFMNTGEIAALALSYASTIMNTESQVGIALAAATKTAMPQFTTGGAGFGGSPVATMTTGGLTLGEAEMDFSSILSVIAMVLEKGAAIASTVAGYQRRKDDWNFQKDSAAKEIDQTERSIAAAELRVAIAEKELENHLLQIDNAKETDAFMHSKYTNVDLYQWQVGQVSSVYFQSYRLAYDLAKGAEQCFRFELGLRGSGYIGFGYWDSLKKGLLSGEKLQVELRRLENAYLEQNRREFELTKSVSLLLLDPLALVTLRETGKCFFSLPEEIFDLDYPGHYFRRIKSMSFSIPCVVGPYTSIDCTLRLMRNSIRINTDNGDNGYSRNTDAGGLPADDLRFLENNISVKAIAASNAQNDSGMFELNFRDERYLPFEGAGVISDWSLELFNDNSPDFGKSLRQFDYGTISDAILHVRYTAREDPGAFKDSAIAHLRRYFSQDGSTPSVRMFNLRQEFPGQWHRFLNPANPADGNTFEFAMAASLFPVRDEDKTLTVNSIWVLGRCTDKASTYEMTLIRPLPSTALPGGNVITLQTPSAEFGGLHVGTKGATDSPVGIEIQLANPPLTWQFRMTPPHPGNLQVSEVEELFLVLGYECGDT